MHEWSEWQKWPSLLETFMHFVNVSEGTLGVTGPCGKEKRPSGKLCSHHRCSFSHCLPFYWIGETNSCFQSGCYFVFRTMPVNNFGRIASNHILLFTVKSLHCPQLQWSQLLARVGTMWKRRAKIRKTERKRVGWSAGVVWGIIECLRGPQKVVCKREIRV